MAIAAPAVPGAAEAVQQSGRTRSEGDRPVAAESLQEVRARGRWYSVGVVLWNTQTSAILTILLPPNSRKNTNLQKGATSLEAGKLGTIEIKGDEVILGKPMIFNKENIDQFNF